MFETLTLGGLFAIVVAATIPSIVVGFVAYTTIRSFLRGEEQRQRFSLKAETSKITLPLKIQAYERMVLLMERLAPNNLVYRVKQKGMSATDLHAALTKDIRQEFEHNISQQLFISPKTWAMIRQAKEEMLKLINESYAKLPKEATALDLSRLIFDKVMEDEEVPTQEALDHVKNEAQRFM